MKYINKSKWGYVIFFICVGLIIFFINLYRSYHGITVSSYSCYSEKISEPIKLVVMSDLHDHIFGDENDELIEKIILQDPDGIFMVGDMINDTSEDVETIINLVEKLKVTAPIYYAMGNHELEWQDIHQEDLQKQMENIGAIVLDENWRDIEIKGQIIRIGGLYDHAFVYQDVKEDDSYDERLAICNFLTDYQHTDVLKIMLAHRPESFVCSDASKVYDIDLVVSGHLHGGQIVLPFIGGLYATEQGWFPEYVHGMYEKDEMWILITSGLSTNKKVVPRWNNPPEIVVLELLPIDE